MMRFFFHLAQKTFQNIRHRRMQAVIKECQLRTSSHILILGIGDGSFAEECKKALQPVKMVAIDLDEENIALARQKDIEVIKSDLNKPFPLGDQSFDLIISDQVIEHLINVDHYVREINRVLKPGGRAVIGTENLSSWHNLFALILGQQAFSQHISYYKNIGNRFALHRKSFSEVPITQTVLPEENLKHQQIFTCRGLREIFMIHGFKIKKLFGVGYLPFPTFLQRLLERIDPYHSFFIGITAEKKED